MKRFNFPFDYVPKVDLKNTIMYSSLYRQIIIQHLYEKYHTIYIDPTLLVTSVESAGSHLNGDRTLAFDNKTTNTIVGLNNAQDNYLMIASTYLKSQNLLTYCPLIKRDAKQTNTSSMINWLINLELAMPHDVLNKEYFCSFIKTLFSELTYLAKDSKLKKIYSPLVKKTRPYGYSTISIQDLEDAYPTLTIEEAIRHYLAKHNFTIVTNNFKKTKNNQWLNDGVLTAVDFDCCVGLYVYDQINDQAINLINIYKRPDGKTSYEQLKTFNPIELSNNIYDKRIFAEDRPTNMCVCINYTNLIYYLLDKVHLAEAVSSIWPDEFIEFVRSSKIEIF